jgi:hypothetical protein
VGVGLPAGVAEVRGHISAVGCLIALLGRPVTLFTRGYERGGDMVAFPLRGGVALLRCGIPGAGDLVACFGAGVADLSMTLWART